MYIFHQKERMDIGKVQNNLNGFYSLNTEIGWIDYFAFVVK